MKLRWIGLAAIVALIYITQFSLRSQNSSAVSSITLPDNISLRVAFGGADKDPAAWDGSIRATGGRITGIEGWRFGADDSVGANQTWKLSTERTPPGAEAVLGPVSEKGVIVTAEGASSDTTFQIETRNGPLAVALRQIPFGSPFQALNGRVRVERVPAATPISSSPNDQDYPALAASGDDVYLAYIEFAHRDRATRKLRRR